MKRILLFIALLLPLSLDAQAPRVKDFDGLTDSLQIRLKQRTGVTSRFKLEKVQARGNLLDFYFSQNLVGQPFRKGDITWLTEQVAQLAQKPLGNYKVGNLYANKQRMSELPQPAPENGGTPLATRFRVKEPHDIPLVQGPDSWPMGLSGRHIALWQSHGRYFDDESGLWDWQRSPNHGTLEDIYTQSYVLPFLIPMLENAGAVVLTPRERDIQTHEAVCDNDPSFTEGRTPGVRTQGHYREKGPWEDAGTGFADKSAIYRDYESPFQMGTARRIRTAVEGEEPAWVIWRPEIEEKGLYAVYVSYKTLPGQSTPDARYTVHHLGGETLLHVNQQMGGGMWIYLGTFLFDKGADGYVELTNVSSSPGVVTADAVRFGGGMGKVERGGSLSGMPAYIEGSLYNFQYSGIPLSITDEWDHDYTRDYAGRGAWVQHISGGSRVNPDADGRRIPVDLSLAFHTDAGITPGDSIIGTLAIYTLKCKNSTTFPNGENRLSSRLLCDLVQSQLVDDIRASYEPDWTRREIWDRSYSESRTTGVPAMLLELLSHQNFADMRYGLDPGFRFTACRAIYKGILKFLSARYGCPYVVQPLPVHAFSARLDSTSVHLSWSESPDSLEPTARADYYKVYTRLDQGGFDEGRKVEGLSLDLPLEPGHVYSFKISACNAGGESFPSEILAAGYPCDGARKVQIVNNFTRVSAPAWFDYQRFAGFSDQLDSGVPWGTDILTAGSVFEFDREAPYTSNDNPGHGGSHTNLAGSQIAGNSFDFVAAHAQAILQAGYAFESCASEAFDGRSNAFAIDLICGKQLTTPVGRGGQFPNRYAVFPAALQEALRQFTAKGGNILLSGSYIGTDAWDRVYPSVTKEPESTRDFVKSVLGYRWVTNFGDISGTARPLPGSGLPAISYNREWSSQVYKVDNADGIAPASAKTRALLRYNGTDIPAATLYTAKGYRVAAFGFPLETSPQMGEILESVLHSFGELNAQ